MCELIALEEHIFNQFNIFCCSAVLCYEILSFHIHLFFDCFQELPCEPDRIIIKFLSDSIHIYRYTNSP